MDIKEQKLRYDLHQNNPEDAGYRAYFQRFLDYVLPLVPQVGMALDFGSGASGLLSSMLTEAGYDTLRYDPIYHPDNSYMDKKYDLIVSTEVFEHLDDPISVIRDLSGLISTGGYLALQTQFHPQDRAGFLDWYYRLDPTHIGFFTPYTFQKISQICDLNYIGDDGINKVIFKNK